MLTNQKQFLYRLYFVASILVVLGLGIGYRIFNIQFLEGEKYRKIAKEKTVKNFIITPKRGNIYSDDGSLLASSTTTYDVYFDAVTVTNQNFNKYINPLSEALSIRFEKPLSFFKQSLINAKTLNKRYHLIVKNVSINTLNDIKKMPLFEMGGIKGGLIIEKKNYREYPLDKIAERTVGYERINKKNVYVGVGLEHAYGELLRGKNGSQLMQKISNGKWKPLDNQNQREPKPGLDIMTTINVGLQDIAHHSLLAQLEKFEADHGSVVVMETKTGAIKAISNLGRTSEGKYYEKLNYAVGESHEPGSTFKLMAMIAALEDDIVESSSIIDTKDGILSFYGSKVRDSKKGGYGKITAKEVFKFSSNTGIVDIITRGYSKNPQKFSDRLYNMGLNNTLNLSIKGEGIPIIPHPKDKNWSGLSLPWMAYGYGVSLTPLQTLSFYNAIANDGELLKPIFLSKKNSNNKDIVNKIVLNPSICSKETLLEVKLMMESVVNERGGTAYNLKSDKFKIAGKTGTCQVDYNKDNVQYISTFVGYFPADKPKYSCIVVIHKPNKSKGYYGNVVAGPVFKRIAEKLFSITPQLKSKISEKDLINNRLNKVQLKITNNRNEIDNLKGRNFYDVLPILENLGFNVEQKGKGLIIKNFRIVNKSNNKKIILELS
jgi:cell division protein FtsI (penicillin-binding protein 3)|tara:strand:+ start:3164 stop:5140 length:1977 start_codon:yes stop_codon:yes gene_type:complete